MLTCTLVLGIGLRVRNPAPVGAFSFLEGDLVAHLTIWRRLGGFALEDQVHVTVAWVQAHFDILVEVTVVSVLNGLGRVLIRLVVSMGWS